MRRIASAAAAKKCARFFQSGCRSPPSRSHASWTSAVGCSVWPSASRAIRAAASRRNSSYTSGSSRSAACGSPASTCCRRSVMSPGSVTRATQTKIAAGTKCQVAEVTSAKYQVTRSLKRSRHLKASDRRPLPGSCYLLLVTCYFAPRRRSVTVGLDFVDADELAVGDVGMEGDADLRGREFRERRRGVPAIGRARGEVEDEDVGLPHRIPALELPRLGRIRAVVLVDAGAAEILHRGPVVPDDPGVVRVRHLRLAGAAGQAVVDLVDAKIAAGRHLPVGAERRGRDV